MNKRIVLEIIIICILGVTGWHMFSVMKQAKLNNPDTKTIERADSLVFTSGAGIDVMGDKVDSIFADKADEASGSVAAFLLRYDSLDSDMEFWNEVGSHLSEPDTTRFVAYCENDRCIEAIRKKTEHSRFTVLEYGAVIDMQAAIGADITGEFWMRGRRTIKIKWRDDVLTPVDIARSIELNL